MTDYSFRIRFRVSPQSNIITNEQSVEFSSNGHSFTLLSGEADNPINQAGLLILKSSGFSSKESAEKTGLRYQDILMLTLTRLRIGSDFGTRKGNKSGFVKSFLDSVEKDTGRRIINDNLGLTVYETFPTPLFVAWPVTFTLGHKPERFEMIFKFIENLSLEFSERERISVELFNASFFVESTDARLICLVMAVEALIEPNERIEVARKHVEELISATKTNSGLDTKDRAAFESSLKGLLRESIGQAGKRLACERLEGREYMNMTPDKFFSKVYSMRSDLVHGNLPYPNFEEVGKYAANLEVFVADLISYRTLTIE
jgi:hypothetical protein